MSTMFRSYQRGVSMITAIFLILVIAVLGAYIASVATTQHTTQTLDLQGAKAYQAAYAGIQWGAYRVLRDNSCAVTTSFAPGALTGFAVTVQCTDMTLPSGYTESGGPVRHVYRITATGCTPPSGTACPGVQGGYYIERQIEATLDQ